jgi:hypothetical protein
MGASEAGEELGAGGGEVAVPGELGLGGEWVERVEAGGGAVGEPDRDGAVERDDR